MIKSEGQRKEKSSGQNFVKWLHKGGDELGKHNRERNGCRAMGGKEGRVSH